MCLNIKICKFLVSNITNCHPLEVVGRSRETQFQVGDNLNEIARERLRCTDMIMNSCI